MIKISLFGILSKRARAFVVVRHARHGVELIFMAMEWKKGLVMKSGDYEEDAIVHSGAH